MSLIFQKDTQSGLEIGILYALYYTSIGCMKTEVAGPIRLGQDRLLIIAGK